MYFFTHRNAGFTITELLVVIALMLIVAGFLLVGIRNYASYQQYNQAASEVKFNLNQTRVRARSAVSDESHGIKFEADRMTQFIGDAYLASDPDNELTVYQLVTIQTDLTGGVDEIVFNKLTGLPSATGTVTVSGTAFSASTTIQITNSGVVE
jgi:prepilin-type N-terminal cleavage/methylation domain-containing protein